MILYPFLYIPKPFQTLRFGIMNTNTYQYNNVKSCIKL